MTRWLITGAAGALGSDLATRLDGQDVVAMDRARLDITAPDLADRLDDIAPTVVLNAAAYTRVDDAEADEQTATAVNADGPGALASWCAAHHARLVHVSTDYVFAGDATTPYQVDAAVAPLSAYGRTKLAGEQRVLAAGGDCHVVRTAWLYGSTGANFVRTIGSRLLQGRPVNVVDDQRGAPTWTHPLADALIALGTADVDAGIWHCSAAGVASWYDVAVAIGEELNVDPSLVSPTTSAEFQRPAPRPAYSVLSNTKWAAAGLPVLADWRHQLAAALADPSVRATLGGS
jgi:dTDP-4-dehydrorhamnose reductase